MTISTIFENRCQSDPQGVIKDLVEQTTKQACVIGLLRSTTFTKEEVEHLLLFVAGDMDFLPDSISEKFRLIFQPEKNPRRKRYGKTELVE